MWDRARARPGGGVTSWREVGAGARTGWALTVAPMRTASVYLSPAFILFSNRSPECPLRAQHCQGGSAQSGVTGETAATSDLRQEDTVPSSSFPFSGRTRPLWC